MKHVRSGEFPLRPVSICEYLEQHPASARAQVQTGAWNVGSTSGFDFSQWAGSDSQRQAMEAIRHLGGHYHRLRNKADQLSTAARKRLSEVHTLLLESETSCFLFWGDSWIPHLL